MFYVKEFYGNIKRIGKIVTMWLHQTCRQKHTHTQIWRNSEAVEETHKVFHETRWELKKPILENWSYQVHPGSPYHWDSLSPFMASYSCGFVNEQSTVDLDAKNSGVN